MNQGVNLFSGSYEPFLDRVKILTPDFSEVKKKTGKYTSSKP
jgi:hypothetical protein